MCVRQVKTCLIARVTWSACVHSELESRNDWGAGEGWWWSSRRVRQHTLVYFRFTFRMKWLRLIGHISVDWQHRKCVKSTKPGSLVTVATAQIHQKDDKNSTETLQNHPEYKYNFANLYDRKSVSLWARWWRQDRPRRKRPRQRQSSEKKRRGLRVTHSHSSLSGCRIWLYRASEDKWQAWAGLHREEVAIEQHLFLFTWSSLRASVVCFGWWDDEGNLKRMSHCRRFDLDHLQGLRSLTGRDDVSLWSLYILLFKWHHWEEEVRS